jgi:predicted aldo/keto reductase-like oxidoreductase
MPKSISRRDFFKITGAAGVGSIVTSMGKLAKASHGSDPEPVKSMTVPNRPFGKTGVRVSMLALGGSQDLMSKQLLLRQAIKMGVTYWDTAYKYKGGNSEKAIGKYFEKYPEDRQSVFLVTKTPSSIPNEMTKHLNISLERLKSSYVDLFFIHSVSNVDREIDHETKAWVEGAKREGKIRFFGFSTHKNMEQCLMDGAKLGWIDGIMTSYNYRLMHTKPMKRAVAACAKAGIGLTAMKTQAPFLANFFAKIGSENKTASALTEKFMKKGFTPEQAKLKAVWENPNIASICSEMTNMTILQANVAAALDKIELSFQDRQLLELYARETAFGYCTGCANLCESAVEGNVPISNIMRYLMYHYNYGDREQANRLFRDLPATIRMCLADLDYSKAEHLCPQRMPIGKLMREAAETFANSDMG